MPDRVAEGERDGLNIMGLNYLNCRRPRPAFTRPLLKQLSRLRCLLLLVSVWPRPPLAEGILVQDGNRLALGQLGGRLNPGSIPNTAVVEDLEIFTRVEEATGQTHTEHADARLPHGHQVRVRKWVQLCLVSGRGTINRSR